MTMYSVVSSNIKCVGYDESSQTLGIIFKDGGSYEYRNVPESVFNDLRLASSVGKYFSQYIKDRYRCRKVR